MDINSTFNICELTNYAEFGIKLESIKFESFFHKNWKIFWSNDKIFSSKNIDLISPHLKIHKLPEMVYGNNRFILINETKDFVYEINPFDMLNFSSLSEREKYYKHKNKRALTNMYENETNIQEKCKTIYYIPRDLKVQFSIYWQNLKLNRVQPATMDWSYSTTYLGSISNLTTHRIYTNHINKTRMIHPNKNVSVDFTDEDIPYYK